MVRDIWLYSLADAARQTNTDVHMSTLVVNHHHTTATPNEDNFPEFLRRLHRDASRGINALLREVGYDVPHHVFDKRPTHRMRLLDGEAQVSQLIHDFLNPVSSGLVAKPTDMPGGPLIEFGHWKGEGFVIKRPPMGFSKERPSEVLLSPKIMPVLLADFDGDLDKAIFEMRRLCRGVKQSMARARPFPPLGARRLRQLHPFDEPNSPAEETGPIIPSFRIGARGLVGSERYRRAATEVATFRRCHRQRRLERRRGETPSFPHGTYELRVRHGVPVDPPLPDALVAAPGPLLHEVEAEFASGKREPTGRRETLTAEVADAWTEAASAVVATEATDLDFRALRTPEAEGASDTDDPTPRPRRLRSGSRRLVPLLRVKRRRSKGKGPPR